MEDDGECDDIELEEVRESYPQYDEMGYHDMLSNFDQLTERLQREAKYGSEPLAITDINRELDYVKMKMEERPPGSTAVPSVEFVEDPAGLLTDVLDAYDDSFDASWDDIKERLSKLKKFSKDQLRANKKRDFENQAERVQAVKRVVQEKEKIVLDPRNRNVRELIKRSSVRTLKDGTEVLMFRSEQGIDKSGVQIMKRGKTSIPTYSKNSTALREYKELVRKIRDEPSTNTQVYTHETFKGDDECVVTESPAADRGAALNEFYDEDNTFENIELMDVRVPGVDIPGLTPKENTELRGVLDPPDTMDRESRLSDDGALQGQVDLFQDEINKTISEINRTTDWRKTQEWGTGSPYSGKRETGPFCRELWRSRERVSRY
ncbi:Hypothetical predicted protein [Paramuricea clavata]|uniref:Uncharacterized protein n=1 Tax=Paramuricea clavata TaxID=317549 RepID=A0A7D9IUB9_PARCT|nr:Hypothetical predicted protein [Paramuricea clavata]